MGGMAGMSLFIKEDVQNLKSMVLIAPQYDLEKNIREWSVNGPLSNHFSDLYIEEMNLKNGFIRGQTLTNKI